MAGINKKEGNQHYDVACIWVKQEHFWESTKKFIYGIRKMIFLPKGEELVTVSFKGWTIGLLICADLDSQNWQNL